MEKPKTKRKYYHYYYYKKKEQIKYSSLPNLPCAKSQKPKTKRTASSIYKRRNACPIQIC